MQRVKITYKKGEEIRFLSHLDHMKVLERAVRRAGIPIEYSQGFNPRPRISYLSKALKVGEVSSECLAELKLKDWQNPQKIKDALNQVLPGGFEILSAEC
ncbi:MAG: TIGR03936 family radical SAM-associated protein [Candidatus Margulisiibacteriota bacterium]|nr:TIGR03936 family radical SAM-associated protein [Candidatus Margulisiibacteriota bacterium]